MQHDIGISGFAFYAPAFAVDLEDFCDWYDQPWDKIRNVIGKSFRQPGSDESVYTMAATAALRLIERYDIDPNEVGFLALGTESSTDNAAGAVIVRGMLDRALVDSGRSPLPRACEVPELKHACLGGVYALKAAARYVAADGAGKKAIVVCGDIAEYERGSSGEPTQGAGAVAMLVEESPKMLRLHLGRVGSSSDYRGLDFRKPVARHRVADYAAQTDRPHDFPVFNGRYSTRCYAEAVASATVDLFDRISDQGSPLEVLETVASIFMHRPYHRMPESGLASIYMEALARDPEGAQELAALAEKAGVDTQTLDSLLASPGRLFDVVLEAGVNADPSPALTAITKAAQRSERFGALVANKMSLGSERMASLGNLYSAALPAWVAAGCEEAVERKLELEGASILAIGYGSGDAAEAMWLTFVPGWDDAASRIGFDDAMADPILLSRAEYERHHDGRDADLVRSPRPSGFFAISRVGDRVRAEGDEAQDVGIEFYTYRSA